METKYKAKFKLLLEKFFQKGFELDSHASENLVKFLEQNSHKCDNNILDKPFFSDLLVYSITNIESVTPSVKLFLMEIISILVKNELQFSKLVHMQCFGMMSEKIHSIHRVTDGVLLRHAAIKIATAQTHHYSGITWIVDHKVWRYVLIPDTHKKAKKVAQATYDFMSNLVWKLIEYDEDAALTEVLTFIIDPIKRSQYLNTMEFHGEDEAKMYDPIMPQLNTLLTIVKNFHNHPNQIKLWQCLRGYFIIAPVIHRIMCMTREQELVTLISDYLLCHTLACAKNVIKIGAKSADEVVFGILNDFFNVVGTLVNKRLAPAVLNFATKFIVTWYQIDNDGDLPTVFERHGRKFDIRNQMLAMVLTPLITYSFSEATSSNNKELMDALDVYLLKLQSMTTEHVVRMGYALRDIVVSGDTKKIVIENLRQVLKLKGCLNISQAGILYQSLFYILKLHVVLDGSGGIILKNQLKTPDDVKLLSITLEAIKMLLKVHNINWYENVEIISLQTVMMDLLKQRCMATKQLLQTIDLIDLTIKKFLSPDLALLMESKTGSTLAEVCTVMKYYIEHSEWEIRDSALQLLLSCTEVAFVKYTPLQKLLLENRLMILAYHAAMHDPEFYVQTTALRCLAAATKIDSIWRELLNTYPDLYIQLMYIMKHNSEGIVRKEATKVLTEIYANQRLATKFTSCMFNVMATAALNDLHWEVQLEALNFWKNVIHRQMSNRGMIDGIFPSVTFSKEKRKIVTLNEKEIMIQLRGMLHDLSSIGCLTVLHKCLNEDSNVGVLQQAYNISKDLASTLDVYKFEIKSDEIQRTRPVDNCDSQDISQEDVGCTIEDEAMDLSIAPPRSEIEMREQIRDTITSTNYHDLIAECYENYVKVKEDCMDEDPLVPPPLQNLISYSVFLKDFKKTDHLGLIESKKNWNADPTTLDGLLDEMLLFSEIKSDVVDECS